MEIVHVEGDAISAELLPEAGARLHRLRAFGHDLLRTPDDPAAHALDPFFWGAYVMAPWANRLRAGPLRAASRSIDLRPNFADGSAIHGQVYDRRWEYDGERFTIAAGGDGWPWPYEVAARVAGHGSTLSLAYTLVNVSDVPMPAGLGLHPWWREPVEVAIASRSVYPTTTDSPPVPAPVGGRFDRRTLRTMPSGIDAAWTDLDDPPVELHWPDAAVALTIRAGAPHLHVVAASAPDLGAVAVEVQTHAPQGLRRLERGEPGALALVDPGSALSLTIELVARREQRTRSTASARVPDHEHHPATDP